MKGNLVINFILSNHMKTPLTKYYKKQSLGFMCIVSSLFKSELENLVNGWLTLFNFKDRNIEFNRERFIPSHNYSQLYTNLGFIYKFYSES